jgi:hypothetical protein
VVKCACECRLPDHLRCGCMCCSVHIFEMALSASAAERPIAKAGDALIDLKPISVVDSKSIAALTKPYGVTAVPAGVSGGGVFVGDRSGSTLWQIDGAGREVLRLHAPTPNVQGLCAARDKLFVLSSNRLHAVNLPREARVCSS